MSRNDAAVRAIREAAARRGNEARVTELSAPRLCALRRRARAARPLTVLLTLDDLHALVEDLAVGPERDLGLLDSAAGRPGAVLYGREAYPDLYLKGAAVRDTQVGNPALVDGHKRLGGLPSRSSMVWTASISRRWTTLPTSR